MRSWPSLHIPIPKLRKASLGVTTAYILFSYIPFRCLCSLSVLVCESCSVDVEMLYVSVPFSKPMEVLQRGPVAIIQIKF